MEPLSKFKSWLLKNCILNDKNDQEIMMRCQRCGKHFWVQVGLVAWNEKHKRLTKCSSCTGKMIPVTKKGDKKYE